MKTNDDCALVDALLSADPAAAEEFVRSYRPRVLALVARARVPASDREDVTQEALRATMRSLADGHFDRRATLSTWIVASTAHQITTYWRRARRRIAGKMSMPKDQNRWGRWEAQEAALLIKEMLRALPHAHREIFARVELAGEPIPAVDRKTH